MKLRLVTAIAVIGAVIAIGCTSTDMELEGRLEIAERQLAAMQTELDAANARATAAETAAESAMEASTAPAAGDGERLANAKSRGNITCATGSDTPGFHNIDSSGNNIGFDIDLCRAIAAATIGDADAVDYRITDLSARGPAMQSGEIDVMNLTTTWTSTRDISWGNFGPVMFYDGQGFMVPKALGVSSATELSGAAVCVTTGTTTELNLADYFRQQGMDFTPTTFDSSDTVLEAYKAGQCDVYTTDRSGLASTLTELDNPQDHVILPEIISEEPLTTVVPHGDENWFDIVKVTMAGIIYAEAMGIHSGNVDQMAAGNDIAVRRLLGSEGGFGQESLGLSQTFMQDVIKQVGNYGEIYERNLGDDGIQIPRAGRNDLWINGGQIYAAPLR